MISPIKEKHFAQSIIEKIKAHDFRGKDIILAYLDKFNGLYVSNLAYSIHIGCKYQKIISYTDSTGRRISCQQKENSEVIIRDFLPTIFEIPECIQHILFHESHGKVLDYLMFFNYIPDYQKHNIEIVCCFHRTIRNQMTISKSKYNIKSLENRIFTTDEEKAEEKMLNLIPKPMIDLFYDALEYVRHETFAEQEKISLSVLMLDDVYERTCKIMISLSNTSKLVKKMFRGYDSKFLFV